MRAPLRKEAHRGVGAAGGRVEADVTIRFASGGGSARGPEDAARRGARAGDGRREMAEGLAYGNDAAAG